MPHTYLPHTCHHQLPYFFSSPSLSTLKHFNPHFHFLNNSHSSPMAERNNPTHQQQQRRPSRANRTVVPSSTFLQKIQSHAPNTTHFLGFLLLFFVSAATLLILTGLTLTATVFGLVCFMPVIVVSSPVWFPICTFLFLTAVGFLSACGFGVAVAAGSTWMYRYFRGMHPPGSDRVDSARTRIYDTASHVKDYAMEYGGYLQSKVKDAAPGA